MSSSCLYCLQEDKPAEKPNDEKKDEKPAGEQASALKPHARNVILCDSSRTFCVIAFCYHEHPPEVTKDEVCSVGL